jgi:eukaryotic-like serine/threonine-protein kinase
LARDVDTPPPASLFGNYRALARLGRGGSSDVYEAEHVALGKRVVLKVLKLDLADNPLSLDRMRLEAQALPRLCHKNLIAVFDFGRTADGRPFYVMERLEGRTLLAELRERGHIPVEEAVGLAQQLLAGLGAAHDAGIIHRDLKLENLFLCDPDGEGRRTLKILDFGIAKVLPDAAGERTPRPLSIQSHESAPVGTPRFLSPEQVLCKEISPRTDIYGAGLVLYELVTGCDPFAHRSDDYLALLEAHVSEPPRPPSEAAPQFIEPAISDVVLRSLEKRPTDRYATAAEFSDALSRALAYDVAGGRERMDATYEGQIVKPGDVFQQYTMERCLGIGLHGEVWLAKHLHTGAPFAMKLMHLQDVDDARKVRRALATAAGAYSLDHANVVKVHDLGCEPSGMVWVRMEYLAGRSIASLLARGPLSVLFALDVAIEVAWGLDAAHEAGIIHRDIKPDNVFLTSGGAVKVLDFSIAKIIPAGIETTVRKLGMGTMPYMAPEQIAGADPDARFDIYALGLMLWETIAGYHPFHDALHSSGEIVRRQLHVDPAPLTTLDRLRHLPEYVDALLRRATAKDPSARFFTIAEMAQAMIRVRDQLRADAEAGRLTIDKPMGEPTLSDPLARKVYRHESTPDPDPPPTMPAARVVLEDRSAATTPPDQTMPLSAGPTGTLLLSGQSLGALHRSSPAPIVASPAENVTERGTAILPREPTPSSPRETPDASTQDRDSAPTPRRRALPRLVSIAVLALVALLGAGTVIAKSLARPPIAPAPAPSVEPSPAPASSPSPTLETPAEPPPSAAPMTSAAMTATASAPAPSAPKPPPSRPAPRKPAATAEPAPKYKPLFGD